MEAADPCQSELEDPLLRALTKEERLVLTLTAPEQKRIHDIANAIQAADFSHPVFSIGEIRATALGALAAYQQRLISKRQFVTQAIRWEALSEYPPHDTAAIQTQPLFNADGSPSDALNKRILEMPPLIGQTMLKARLIARLRELPQSEQFFWEYASYTSSVLPPRLSGTTFFSDYFGVFKVRRLAGQPLNLVQFPSFGIIQTYFDVVFETQGFHLIPQLGQTDRKEVLRGIRDGGRVVTLSLPDVNGVLDAHHTMGRLVATAHDLTHAFEGAFLPNAYRTALAHFYDVLTRFEGMAARRKTAISLDGDNYYAFPLKTPIILPGQSQPITQFAIRRSLITKEFNSTHLTGVRDNILDLNVYGTPLFSADNQTAELQFLQNYPSAHYFNRDFGNHENRFEMAPRFRYQNGIVYPNPSNFPEAALNYEMRDVLLLILLDMREFPQIYSKLGINTTELVRALQDTSAP